MAGVVIEKSGETVPDTATEVRSAGGRRATLMTRGDVSGPESEAQP